MGLFERGLPRDGARPRALRSRARDARRDHAPARDRRPRHLPAHLLRDGRPAEHDEPHALRRPRRHVPPGVLRRLPSRSPASREAAPVRRRRRPLAAAGQHLPDPERERGHGGGGARVPTRPPARRAASGEGGRRVRREGGSVRASASESGRGCPSRRVRGPPLEAVRARGPGRPRRVLERKGGAGGERLPDVGGDRPRRERPDPLSGRTPLARTARSAPSGRASGRSSGAGSPPPSARSPSPTTPSSAGERASTSRTARQPSCPRTTSKAPFSPCCA